MKITIKNLKAKKKALVTLACKIVHARDPHCMTCGKTMGQMHASHIIPRSRGWRYAVDVNNIIKQCARCHMQWHECPTEGVEKLRATCLSVYEYTRDLCYSVKPVTVAEAQEMADTLEVLAKEYGL